MKLGQIQFARSKTDAVSALFINVQVDHHALPTQGSTKKKRVFNLHCLILPSVKNKTRG